MNLPGWRGLLALTTGFAFCILLVVGSLFWQYDEHQHAFDAEVLQYKLLLSTRIQQMNTALSYLSSQFTAAQYVDADQFRKISTSILEKWKFLNNTFYAPRVRVDDLAGFEAMVRDLGYPAFTVSRELKLQNFYPVRYFEPFTPLSVRHLGEELQTNPGLSVAIQEAIQTGEPVLTQENGMFDDRDGFGFIRPIFASRDIINAQHQKDLVSGIVGLTIDFNLFTEGAYNKSDGLELVLRSTDGRIPLVEKPVSQQSRFRFSITSEDILSFAGHYLEVKFIRVLGLWDLVSVISFLAFLLGLFLVFIFLVLAKHATARNVAEVALRQSNAELENKVRDRTIELEDRNALLNCIDKLRRHFINEPDPFVLFPAFLDELLMLTRSEFGFVGDVLHDDDGSPYLKAYALSNLAWDDESENLYETQRNKGFEFRKLDNLFGLVVTTGKPVISNDPLNDPRRTGFPKGHPQLSSFLGIPVYFGEQLVGEIGLANRPGGYNEELLAFISPVVEACGQIITARWEIQARQKAENELIEYQASLEKIVEERTVDLKGALKAAEKSNKAKSIFLANMSHELRTPMHAIINFSNLALKKVDDEKIIHYLDNIINSGHRLTDLLNDLLDLSKLEAGKMEVDFKEQDITQLILSTTEEVGSLLSDQGIDIEFDSNQHFTCMLDRKLFTQVIVNLLSNAIKFSPEHSTITIRLGLESKRVQGKVQDVVELAVIDEGVGIPKDELTSIFEQFEQSTKTSSKAGGTGLGLSITRSIVRLHKGKIWAESPPRGQQHGSGFYIQFPLVQD